MSALHGCAGDIKSTLRQRVRSIQGRQVQRDSPELVVLLMAGRCASGERCKSALSIANSTLATALKASHKAGPVQMLIASDGACLLTIQLWSKSCLVPSTDCLLVEIEHFFPDLRAYIHSRKHVAFSICATLFTCARTHSSEHVAAAFNSSADLCRILVSENQA